MPAPEPAVALPQPTAARQTDATRATGRRFTRRADWPAGSEALWRCEIKWHAGYVNSYFEASAHSPGRRRGITLAQSDLHKWLMKDDPERGNALYTGQVRRLADQLVEAGGAPAGQGRWYQLRFALAARSAAGSSGTCGRGSAVTGRVTRAGLLWAGSAAAGGATVALRGGAGASEAAPSKADDEDILRFFLTLEHVQEAFYRQAVESGRLEGRAARAREPRRRPGERARRRT